jgi:hypothetical protein
VIRPGDMGGERNMASTYKDRLLKEIEGFPEEKIAKLYKIIHILRTELMQKVRKTEIRGSLKGIWRGSQIEEELFLEARKSLFPYEAR